MKYNVLLRQPAAFMLDDGNYVPGTNVSWVVGYACTSYKHINDMMLLEGALEQFFNDGIVEEMEECIRVVVPVYNVAAIEELREAA